VPRLWLSKTHCNCAQIDKNAALGFIWAEWEKIMIGKVAGARAACSASPRPVIAGLVPAIHRATISDTEECGTLDRRNETGDDD
jgi:hypothetical protein